MVSSNWLIFIYSVTYNQVLQSSLGYFISPLLFVALAVAVLRERLRGAQLVAIVIAALGVGYLVARFGQIPGSRSVLPCRSCSMACCARSRRSRR
jgi:chloramphenicol-sensitive protein RarD